MEQVNNEINALDLRIKKIKKQIDSPATEEDIKLQMDKFLLVSVLRYKFWSPLMISINFQEAEREVAELQRAMKELDLTRVQLSEFFCEDPASFKLEECFKVFFSFCEKFRQAVKENEKRRIQEEQANIRRKQREEQLANKRRQREYFSIIYFRKDFKTFLIFPQQ